MVPGEKEKTDNKESSEAETEEAKKIVEALTGQENETGTDLHIQVPFFNYENMLDYKSAAFLSILEFEIF